MTCCASLSYVTLAAALVAPCATVDSWIVSSSAFKTIVDVGRLTRTMISASPVNLAVARSGVKVSV